jgi:hypothetical protein
MPAYTAAEPTQGGGASNHVPPGIYDVLIKGAKEKISNGGNDMIELSVRILPDGPDVRDFLVFTQKAFWKIDQVRAAIGDAVIPGEKVLITAERFIGKQAKCNIGEEPGSKNPDVKFNNIESWILPAAGDSQEEIPF